MQLPKEQRGLDASAIYIDTENTFRPERIVCIAENRKLDPKSVLERITVAKAYNSAHQELVISEIGDIIDEYPAPLLVAVGDLAHADNQRVQLLA